ncbi:MAG: dienelactone hydrolase family protein [Deltaproteobacteria bacterium]|nr:dienelactone hydrolase family protein [Deltaproteobacteria bacterium]
MPTAPTTLRVRTADGTARALLFLGGPGPLPGVVLYGDAFGPRAALQQMASRLAGLGYAVLLPELFYREGPVAPFDIATVWSVPAERERLMALVRSISAARVAVDGAAYLEALAAQAGVHPDRLGVVGYCLGGRMAFLTAAQQPARVRAAASFHGSFLVSDAADSPHRLAGRIQAPLYLGVADGDRACTPEHQGALATALSAAGVPYCLELYRGARHGFAVSDNVDAYEPAAAERHWSRLERFLGESLG